MNNNDSLNFKNTKHKTRYRIENKMGQNISVDELPLKEHLDNSVQMEIMQTQCSKQDKLKALLNYKQSKYNFVPYVQERTNLGRLFSAQNARTRIISPQKKLNQTQIESTQVHNQKSLNHIFQNQLQLNQSTQSFKNKKWEKKVLKVNFIARGQNKIQTQDLSKFIKPYEKQQVDMQNEVQDPNLDFCLKKRVNNVIFNKKFNKSIFDKPYQNKEIADQLEIPETFDAVYNLSKKNINFEKQIERNQASHKWNIAINYKNKNKFAKQQHQDYMKKLIYNEEYRYKIFKKYGALQEAQINSNIKDKISKNIPEDIYGYQQNKIKNTYDKYNKGDILQINDFL